MKIDFEKYANGLVPTIVQDSKTQKVLMLGFTNRESLKKMKKLGKVTFYSRSQRKLWTKGETSGNFLQLKEIFVDCDNDTLLIKAVPKGKVCHRGFDTCFNEINRSDNFLLKLETIIEDRKTSPKKTSNTSKLFEQGINQIAKKFGEEAVELVIEAMDKNDDLFKEEAADLLYNFMVLIIQKGIKLDEILDVLRDRNK